MDSNIDESITQIYEKQQTMSGSEEEAMQFLNILDNHEDLNIKIKDKEEEPVKISLKSWNQIIKKIPEEESYALEYICFSLVKDVPENEIWGLNKSPESGDEDTFQDVFFNTVLEASVPHEIPFVMCEEDFSQFTDYFNQKEEEDRNLKLSNEDWNKENLMNKEKEETESKEKEDENQNTTEVTKQIVEDKDGVKKLITTKTVTSTQTIYKKKIQPTKDKEKDVDKNIPSETTEKIGEQKPVKQKDEPQSKMIRKKVILKEGKEKEKKEDLPKEEDVVYTTVKQGKYRPKMKVLRKKIDPRTGKEKEEEILDNEIIYETDKNKPDVKILRKKRVLKNGKEEEIEEEPNKKVVYMVKKFGRENEQPQTKIIRKNIVPKYGRETENEEDIPGDELIVKTIKEGPNKESKKIIIKKDGKNLKK